MKKPVFYGVEFSQVCVLTAVNAEVIDAYNGIVVPILSWIVPGTTVNEVLGFFLALVIVLQPVFVWSAAYKSRIFKEPARFFRNPENVIWFLVGVVGLLSVFGIETFNFYAKAYAELENIAPCSANNPFRPLVVCDQEIEATLKKIERAIPYAFLFSTANILIAAGGAFLIRKK